MRTEELAMSDPLSNAASVGPVGGFPGHSRHDVPKRRTGTGAQPQAEPGGTDEVTLHPPETIARRLLRERVLYRTRQRLELRDGEFVPSFAEAVDAEPIAAFLGRLLGAQNQLAALRTVQLSQPELRSRLDLALREGTAEVVEMLSRDGDDAHALAAVEVVAEVLAEYARRLTDLTT
ncbi:MAG: hypothetical protein ACE37K_25125 [Planctomycetota bacterium]